MGIAGVGYTAYTSYMPGSRSETSQPALPVMQNASPQASPGLLSPAYQSGYNRNSALMFLSKDGDSVELSLPARQSYPLTPGIIPMRGFPAGQSLPVIQGSLPPGVQGTATGTNTESKPIIPEMPGTGLLDSLKPEGECQTCANRKYVDGSDDPSVSYQTPTKISSSMSAAAVSAHEQEHVRNEQADAQRDNRQVVSQTVTLQYDCCPECGKSYVSGGTTRTMTTGKKEINTLQNNTENNNSNEE